jgi:hypothetical protein
MGPPAVPQYKWDVAVEDEGETPLTIDHLSLMGKRGNPRFPGPKSQGPIVDFY